MAVVFCCGPKVWPSFLNPRSDFVHYVHTALVDPDRGVKIGLNYSSWGVFGPPKAPVASERAPGVMHPGARARGLRQGHSRDWNREMSMMLNTLRGCVD